MKKIKVKTPDGNIVIFTLRKNKVKRYFNCIKPTYALINIDFKKKSSLFKKASKNEDIYIETLTIPALVGSYKVETIEKRVFDTTKIVHIKTLIIPDDVIIKPQAFDGVYNNVNIEHLIWPNNCIVIPEYCFYSSRIKRISNTNKVKIIELSAFQESYIETIDSIDKVEFVRSGAFVGTEHLKSFCWPSHCKMIPESCFEGSSIEYISNIGRVDYIGIRAFCGSKIKEFFWPEYCEALNYECFFNCKDLKAIYNSNRIKRINACVFSYCSNLTTIDLDPDRIEHIAAHAFKYVSSNFCLDFTPFGYLEDEFVSILKELNVNCKLPFYNY